MENKYNEFLINKNKKVSLIIFNRIYEIFNNVSKMQKYIIELLKPYYRNNKLINTKTISYKTMKKEFINENNYYLVLLCNNFINIVKIILNTIGLNTSNYYNLVYIHFTEEHIERFINNYCLYKIVFIEELLNIKELYAYKQNYVVNIDGITYTL